MFGYLAYAMVHVYATIRYHVAVNLGEVNLPAKSGVYLFKNAEERVLYVGKATNLKQRIRSYFAKNPDRAMIPDLIENAIDVELFVTNNPQEALILERQLIREHRPRYNSMLKDDKSFPYIAITKEKAPRLLYTRRPPKSSWVWGPFPNAGAAKTVVQLMRRHFGLRDCKELLPQGCLSMHIGLCSGPCIDDSDYDTTVRHARATLDGKAGELIESIAQKMDEAAKNMKFEEAAKYRDQVKAIRTVVGQQVISSTVYRDCDAIGIAVERERGAVVVIHANQGIIKGQETWPMIHRGDIGETVNSFISQHYATRIPPKLILTPTPVPEIIVEWLSDRRGSRVEVRTPLRGDLAPLRKMAEQNAAIQLQNQNRKRKGNLEQLAADEGAKVLDIDSLNHIVCFDMAQFLGDERVGASITLRHGRPAKKEYRTYIVKTNAMDDLKMMREVVERWLKKQSEWPDLLLIDGGQTHLSVIHNLLLEHGIDDRLQLASLAKKEETIHRIDKEDIILDKKGRVLVHARDEAHRFVNNFHRKRRGRKKLTDPLSSVEGLGAKKLQMLIRHFGGRQGIKNASVQDLKQTNGIGKALAQRIYDALH